eukprot:COSAG02_NODE_1598_length_11761_cov_15.902418_12_plen_88_part_00
MDRGSRSLHMELIQPKRTHVKKGGQLYICGNSNPASGAAPAAAILRSLAQRLARKVPSTCQPARGLRSRVPALGDDSCRDSPRSSRP